MRYFISMALAVLVLAQLSNAGEVLVGTANSGIIRIDWESGNEIARVGGSAWDIAPGPSGNLLVSSKSRHAVETYTVPGLSYAGDFLSPGFVPYSTALNPQGNRLYVTNYFSDEVVAFDVNSGIELQRIYASRPTHLRFGDDGLLYVNDPGAVGNQAGHINRISESRFDRTGPTEDGWEIFYRQPGHLDEPYAFEFEQGGSMVVYSHDIIDGSERIFRVGGAPLDIVNSEGWGVGDSAFGLGPSGEIIIPDMRQSVLRVINPSTGLELRQIPVPGLPGNPGLPSVRSVYYVAEPGPRPILFAENGHYYEYVSMGRNWFDARDEAATRSYLGLPGYLATVTSEAESNFLRDTFGEVAWLGATDIDTEGTWVWETGPEAGDIFWAGGATGGSVGGAFANWETGEPNNQGDDEDALHTWVGDSLGKWNDTTPYDTPGYYVEYSHIPEPPPCDFNRDGDCDVADLDMLTLVGDIEAGVSVPPADARFDLTGDGVVEDDDLREWMASAATENGFASAYRYGDADLNRKVDITDFNTLAMHFDPGAFNADNAWSLGDFDGDDDIDIVDFALLAVEFNPGGYGDAPTLTLAVPEPASLAVLAFGVIMLMWRRDTAGDNGIPSSCAD